MKTQRLKLGLGLCAFVLCLVGQSAKAQDRAALMGLAYGITVPDADNTNPRFMFGFTGTAYLGTSFSFGGYYYMGGAEEGSGARNFNYSMAGLQAFYNLPLGQTATFFGAKFGMTKLKTRPGNADLIFSPYHMGIAAGSDYFITERICVGVEGFFLRMSNSTTNLNGQAYSEDSFNLIGFMATTKMSF